MLFRLRQYKDISWLFFLCGSLACLLWLAYNLRSPAFSGATAMDVAQMARQATLQQVDQAIMAVGDPDTSDTQIKARWQSIAENHDAPIAVVELAKKSCASRTWPVELRPGRVDGTTV